MWLAKLGKGTLSSVEQAFVGRDEKRAPVKKPVWQATLEALPTRDIDWYFEKGIKQQSLIRWWCADTEFELETDKKIKTKNWPFFPTCHTLKTCMVRVSESKIIFKWSEEKQKLLWVSGRFELSKVWVTKGKITVNMWRKFRGNRLSWRKVWVSECSSYW